MDLESQQEPQPSGVQQQAQPEANKTSKARFHSLSIVSIVLNLLIGYFFLRYSYVHSRECFYLGGFAHWFGLIVFWTSVIIIIIVWPCQCCHCVSEEFSVNLFDVTMSAQSTSFFIFLVAFSIVVFFNEPCGALRSLVLLYLLIVYSLILISCCVGGAMMRKS